MQEHPGVWTCSTPRMTTVQKNNCMEKRLQDGPVSVMGPIITWAHLRNYMGKYEEYCKPQSNEVWARFYLLTSFRQGNCSINKWYNAMQAQVNLAKYPPRNCQNTPQGHFLVLLKRWRFHIPDHQWWKCWLRQVPSKQSMAISQKTWELKSYCEAYKTSIRGTPGYPDQPTVTSEDWTCHNIDIKRRHLIQNPSQVTTNHMDMTNIKVKYHRGTKWTTNQQLNTDWHLQITSIDVWSVVTLPTVKALHVQLKVPEQGIS